VAGRAEAFALHLIWSDESAGTSGMAGQTCDADRPAERIVATWQTYAAHLGTTGATRRRHLGVRMTETMPLLIDRLDTQIGEMLIVADRKGNLRSVGWADYETGMRRLLRLHYGENGLRLEPARNPNGLTQAISRYFEGELTAIDILPVQTAGTPFQREVWRALRNIPCGTTVSYAGLAKQIGRPAAVRAVGLANGSNPVGVVVPCHRVIGANGSLTGYGGGIQRKSWLLEHEGSAPTMQRKLVKLIEKGKRITVYTDFKHTIGGESTIDLPGVRVGADFGKFRAKATQFLRANENHFAIRKLRFNEKLTKRDVAELERILLEAGTGTAEDIERAKSDGFTLGLFLRSLIGLDREAAKDSLDGFLQDRTLSSNQIEFVNLIVDYLIQRGWMDPSSLYESPFTEISAKGVEGVFDPKEVERLLAALANVRQRAEV
jgi:methylated-DNA-[protein]-cysteine S-methyltransferase